MRNMLLKATFPSSCLGLVKATLAALKKWLPSRTACYDFVSVKNTSLSQQYIIYSPPFGWAATPYSPAKRSDSASQKQADSAWHGSVFHNPPLIDEASTIICTRPNFRAAPLFPNLDCNICPTFTLRANTFLRISRNRVQASNPHLKFWDENGIFWNKINSTWNKSFTKMPLACY